jgi:hypothetical protein
MPLDLIRLEISIVENKYLFHYVTFHFNTYVAPQNPILGLVGFFSKDNQIKVSPTNTYTLETTLF